MLSLGARLNQSAYYLTDTLKGLAERVGFEPTVPVKAQRFSRPSQSTTLAPLRSRITGSWAAYRGQIAPHARGENAFFFAFRVFSSGSVSIIIDGRGLPPVVSPPRESACAPANNKKRLGNADWGKTPAKLPRDRTRREFKTCSQSSAQAESSIASPRRSR